LLNNIIGNQLCSYPKSNYIEGTETLIKYPSDIGLTGKVFKDNKWMMSNIGKEERGFHAIDTMEYHRPVKNFIFAPTYGFRKEKNGVIQLFNKKEEVNEEEVNRLKPYQHLFGMIMQSLLEADKAVNIELDIKKIVESIKAPSNIKEGILTSAEEIHRIVYKLQKIIDDNVNLRQKHKERIMKGLVID